MYLSKTSIEDGIYCELNLEECITYAIPPGSSESDLNPLTESLLRHIDRFETTLSTANNLAIETSQLNIEQPYSVQWTPGAETESVLVLPDSVSTQGVPITLSLNECVGKIAAESVCITFNFIDILYNIVDKKTYY